MQVNHEQLVAGVDAIAEAQVMSEWFADYLYGIQEKPGILPRLTVDRLHRQFGEGERHAQLGLLRDEFMIFSDEQQPNLANYLCGFPEDALELLADGDIAETIRELDDRFPPPPTNEGIAPIVIVTAETTVAERRRAINVARKEANSLAIPAGDTKLVTSTPIRPLSTTISDELRNQTGVVNMGVGEHDANSPLSWQVDALCAQTNPEAFFPEKGGSTRDAKRICTDCDVKEQCLNYALQNDERFGIWGGKSERERKKLLKRKARDGQSV